MKQLFINESDELIHLTVNGEEITTTPTHPFYVAHKGWYAAVDLRAGDILVLVNGEYVTLEKTQHEILEAPITVYNFEVEDYHTYYVGTDGVLVHNECPGVSEKTEVHHIVEQCQQKKSGFSREAIQAESYKISIPYTTHRKISGHYSSKPLWTNGKRVRDFLAGKSFAVQRRYGIWILRKFVVKI